VSGGWDSAVKLWNRETGEKLAESIHHPGFVTKVHINQEK